MRVNIAQTPAPANAQPVTQTISTSPIDNELEVDTAFPTSAVDALVAEREEDLPFDPEDDDDDSDTDLADDMESPLEYVANQEGAFSNEEIEAPLEGCYYQEIEQFTDMNAFQDSLKAGAVEDDLTALCYMAFMFGALRATELLQYGAAVQVTKDGETDIVVRGYTLSQLGQEALEKISDATSEDDNSGSGDGDDSDE